MPHSYDHRIDAMTNPFWPKWLRGPETSPAPRPLPTLKELWDIQQPKLKRLFGGSDPSGTPTAPAPARVAPYVTPTAGAPFHLPPLTYNEVSPTVAQTAPLAPLAERPLEVGQIPVIPREFTLRQPPPTAVLSEDLGRKYEDIWAAEQRAPLAAMPNKVDWGFIGEREGTKLKAYALHDPHDATKYKKSNSEWRRRNHL